MTTSTVLMKSAAQLLRPRTPSLGEALLRGAVAGAAGTTALNAVTYLDMAVRGRGASSIPEQSVEKLSEKAHVSIPGDDETQQNRVSGLGPLLGIAAGVGTGASLGAVRATGLRPPFAVEATAAGLGASVAGSGPMTALGITDPRSWSATDWVADAVPHAAYALVTAWALRPDELTAPTGAAGGEVLCARCAPPADTRPDSPAWCLWRGSHAT